MFIHIYRFLNQWYFNKLFLYCWLGFQNRVLLTVHYFCVTEWIHSSTLPSHSSAVWGWKESHHIEREPRWQWIERSGRVKDKNGALDVSERAREREEALLACLMCEFNCGESKWLCSVCGHRETRSFNSPTSPDWLYHSNSPRSSFLSSSFFLSTSLHLSFLFAPVKTLAVLQNQSTFQEII